jgi:hypothetical protein
MQLYNADLSPNALRVRAVANELDARLELIDVDLRNAEAKVQALLNVSPNTKVCRCLSTATSCSGKAAPSPPISPA